MSKRKELQDTNNNILKAIDESFKKIKEVVDSEPKLHERKMEAEAFNVLLEHASDVDIEEMYGKLLPIQERDKQSYTLLNSQLGEVNKVFNQVYVNTSGTTSASVEIAYKQVEIVRPYMLAEPVRLAYQEIADYKSRKVEIPKRLAVLRPDLGKMFLSVHDTVIKAKNKTITVKQAISDMRDVLNQVWANLANLAATKYPDKWKGISSKQFKNIDHHKLIAECLMNNPINKGKFELLLNNMYSLFTDMSQTSIGKNPLSEDYDKLEEFYSRWIIHIDGVVGMIDWRE